MYLLKRNVVRYDIVVKCLYMSKVFDTRSCFERFLYLCYLTASSYRAAIGIKALADLFPYFGPHSNYIAHLRLPLSI